MMDNEWADFVENQKKEYKKNHPEEEYLILNQK